MKKTNKTNKKQDEKDKQNKQENNRIQRYNKKMYNKYIVENGTSDDHVCCQSCNKIVLTRLMYNRDEHIYLCFECFMQGKQPHDIPLGFASSYKIEDQKIVDCLFND
jgi:hypothetical protein